MVKLLNIKIEGDIITCDLIPESSEKSCQLIFNVSTDEYECKLPEGYEYCKSHVAMARNWLRKNKDKEMPEEKLIMWY